MLKVKVNNKAEHEIDFTDEMSGTMDGNAFTLDMITVKDGSFHIIKDDKSYQVEVLKIDDIEKTVLLKVNGNKYNVVVKDKYDELLKSLGMDNMNARKVNELKAPMPGMVIEIKVKVGDEIKKGDALIVLEAMKMENNIKSPTDGTISKINVSKGNAVEKNQVLISFQ